MPFSFEPMDFSQIRTYPLKERENKVSCQSFARIPEKMNSFSDFMEMMPSILAGQHYREIIEGITLAHQKGRIVIVTMGAHVIKVGLSPLIIELMKSGIINAIALNGAGSIHDSEIALIGETSEDVARGIKEGNFGMVEETGAFINQAAAAAYKCDRGFGEVLGEKLADAPHADLSILAQGRKLGIPVTVHLAFGSDIIHAHPMARGEELGKATFNDFRLFCGIVSKIEEGSVIMNIGSAVVLPTVIEKAIAITRNQGYPVRGFMGVTLDFIRHYRAGYNPVERARELGGKGYYLIGHHELMIPLLTAGILDRLAKSKKDDKGQ
ncbi:MAG: hypothetical protein AB9903_19835 [Vulcanimicrobiota bacterium]